jgi:PhnB protein
MHIEPYLFFEGRTEEALQFYQKALGAKVEMMMRNKESPEPPPPGMNAPGDKIMHSSFLVDGARVMASDGMCSGKPSFGGFSLSITKPSEVEARKVSRPSLKGGR